MLRAPARIAPFVLVLSLAAAALAAPPTPEQAARFVEEAEARLLQAWIRAERAAWVQANFITEDTQAIAAEAHAELLRLTGELARESARFDGLDLPPVVRRKLTRIKLSLPLAAPPDPRAAAELASLASELEALYGKGRWCPDDGRDCLDLGALSRILARSRKPDELLEAWVGWRTISPPMRPKYRRFVELGNEGARALGFPDLGAMWRAGYDMPPDAFAAELERLWSRVRPLYEKLHCYVRSRLVATYGPEVVPPDGPIPAHLLGNMWAQEWGNIYDLVAPGGPEGVDLTAVLRERKISPEQMVRIGERFFVSLGFDPLPETFWKRSLLTRPRDRDVVCHASAWAVDFADDLRIKMCIDVTAEDFVTIHHELGHVFYYQAYRDQDPLFRAGANDGFHEAVGDTIALSVTPAYLETIGLIDRRPPADAALSELMRRALDKVAFLPFGLVIDSWRWKVFSGEIPPERYNAGWWELRRRYQGIAPPVARSERDFDPGAKYHVPANTPYTRYFLAAILQFQFHRALCRAAGHEGPLHECSIYGSEEAGRRLRRVLALGASRPWQDALYEMTGERTIDASALVEYFAPLERWLDEQNRGRTCGW
ncbi:MAG: peptidase M2 family protein [Acidobacteria bacterium]|nr:MAG: peptidase M2 family protein [Acidobacteriota bacterium]